MNTNLESHIKDDLTTIKTILLKTSQTFNKTYHLFFLVSGLYGLQTILALISYVIRNKIAEQRDLSLIQSLYPIISYVTMSIDYILIIAFILFYFYYRKKYKGDIKSLSSILIDLWGILLTSSFVFSIISVYLIRLNVLSLTLDSNVVFVYPYVSSMFTITFNSLIIGSCLFVTGLLTNKNLPKFLSIILFVFSLIILYLKPSQSFTSNYFGQYNFILGLVHKFIIAIIIFIFANSLIVDRNRKG